MPSIFSKNCVLSGYIDYYCVICEAQFKNEEETLAHITDVQHKDKWKSCGYFEKYKQDYIKKMKGLYFCELCSMTFPTATKVGLHVDEPSHITEKDKRNQFIKRVKNDILVMDKYVIKEEAWNGFIDDTCVLCNTEFDDCTTHKASKKHILNLIKSKVVVYQPSDFAYREIDASSAHCLICNKIFNEQHSTHAESAAHKSSVNNVTSEHEKETQKFADNSKDNKTDSKIVQETVVDKEEMEKNKLKDLVESSNRNSTVHLEDKFLKKIGAPDYITKIHGEQWCILCEFLVIQNAEEHVRSQHHQTLLKMHKERLENVTDRNDNVTSNGTKSNLFESVDKYQKNSVNIDLINETATCKKCVKNIDFNIEAIERHIEEHNKPSNKKLQANAVPFLSGIKSNGSDKTTLYTKPVLLTADKDKEPTRSATASSATEIEVYAKQHGLTHNRADKSYYCGVCCRRLPMTLKDLEKHVSSSGHIQKTTKQSNTENAKKATEKKPITKFIESFELVEDRSRESITVFMIINNKYWINAFSFCLIAKNLYNTIFCHACNIDLNIENVMQHILTSTTHTETLRKSFFITSLENEFVREINTKVYHCGYCNTIVRDWDDLLDHLESPIHEREKSQAQNYLRNHTPNPNTHFRVIQMETMFKSFMNQFL